MSECKNDKYCGCLFYSANALARVITRIAEEEYAPTGLTPSYAFLVLTVNEKPGIQAGEISEIMRLNPSTITRFIEKMEEKGLLTRKTNGKFTEVYPTEKGLALNETITTCWKNLYNRYVSVLGVTQANMLTMAVYEAVSKLENS